MCSWSCPNNVLFCPRLVPIPTLPLVWRLFWPPGVRWPCVRYCELNLDDPVLYGCPTKNNVVRLIHFLGRIFFPPPSSKLIPQPSNLRILFWTGSLSSSSQYFIFSFSSSFTCWMIHLPGSISSGSSASSDRSISFEDLPPSSRPGSSACSVRFFSCEDRRLCSHSYEFCWIF